MAVPERIRVVGVGPDGAGPPPAAVEAAAQASLVVGAQRHLDALRHRQTVPRESVRWVPLGALAPALDAIAACEGTVLVLASGDPGFFGIVRVLAHRFGAAALDVTPAVSSVAAVCARLGLPWDDVVVASAHGRDPHAAVAAALAGDLVAVLTSPDFTPVHLGRALTAAGAGDRRLVVGERLGSGDERVTETTARAPEGPYASPNVVLVLPPGDPLLDPGAPTIANGRRPPDAWALPTAAFEHRGGMVSKPEVRALALACIGPATGRLVWDVGAGCGSVAVECARFGAAVIAVERDPDEADRCRRNATSHGVEVQVRTGTAPAALADLPDPDAVFVGGGGAALPGILDVVAARARRAVVVALAAVERVSPAVTRLRDGGWEAGARLVAVQELLPLGSSVRASDGSPLVHRLDPHNPVWLVTAQRGGSHRG